MADATITFDILAKDRASDAFRSAGDSAGGLESKFQKTLGKVGGMVAGAFAVSAVVDFGAKLLDAGQSSEIFQAKAKTVFGEAAADIAKWADETAGAFGMTDSQLEGLAAGFGDLLVPMGFTRDEAAKMTKDTVELSGALSAWSGGQTSAKEAADILAKAMLGERDGLKALGISISDADVKQRLMEKGQQDLTGAALAQATAMATQELITEKSTDAQAAWTNGSMDATKKQNELKAKLAEVFETLGEKLLPVAVAFTEWLVDEGIPFVEDMVETLTPWVEGIIAVSVAIGETLVDGFNALLDASVPIIKTVLDAFLGAVENIVKGAATAFGWVPGLGGKMKDAAKAIEGFRDDANAALQGILDRHIVITFERVFVGANPDGTTVRRRAMGGPVTALSPYLVGEKGPELFVPNASGAIVPNHDLGGGLPDPEEWGRAAAKSFGRTLVMTARTA